jgi:hypothetical protein
MILLVFRIFLTSSLTLKEISKNEYFLSFAKLVLKLIIFFSQKIVINIQFIQ